MQWLASIVNVLNILANVGTVWGVALAATLYVIRLFGDWRRGKLKERIEHLRPFLAAISSLLLFSLLGGFIVGIPRFAQYLSESSVVTDPGQVKEYHLPTSNSQPSQIATAPDGNLWLTEINTNSIARLSIDGSLHEVGVGSRPGGMVVDTTGEVWVADASGINRIQLVTSGETYVNAVPTWHGTGQLASMALGPDGTIWFTEPASNKVGYVSSLGQVIEMSLPNANSAPTSITMGPDKAMWFTEYAGNRIGRVSLAGKIAEFSVPTAHAGPYGIVAGSSNNLWFTESNADQIGEISVDGKIAEVAYLGGGAEPKHIVLGPDHAVWFTDYKDGTIGRLTMNGQVGKYRLPNQQSHPDDLAIGPYGTVWFTENTANEIGRLTPSNQFSEIAPLSAGATFGSIMAGPNGTLWFTEPNVNDIGFLRTPNKTSDRLEA